MIIARLPCDWPLGSESSKLPGEHMTEQKDTIFCSKCGTQLPSTANYCLQCGHSQKATTQSDSVATSLITLARRWAWGAGDVAFDVFIDDQYAGNIRNSATTQFTVPPGEHKIYVALQTHSKSELLVVRLAPNENVALVCGIQGFNIPSPYLKRA
jgi:hypothetical protein